MKSIKPVHVVPLALCLALTACGGAAKSTSGAESTAPQLIRSAGKLKVATHAVFPPMTSKNEQDRFEGVDIDLAEEIGRRWGVKVEFADIKWEGLITGVQGDRFDVAMSDISANPSRAQQVDFVVYAKAFSGILVQKGNPHGVFGLDDLCGKPIATQTASHQLDMMKKQSEKCVSEGKPALKISEFPDSAQLELEVRGGRSAAQVRDFLLAKYRAERSSDDLEVVTKDGAPIRVGEEGPIGVAVRKGNSEVTDALTRVMQQIIDDGTYRRILDKHGAGSAAVDRVSVYAG